MEKGAVKEPMSKERRLLDAGGPVEDAEVARRKMRDARVGEPTAETRSGYAGFDPDTVNQLNPIYSEEYLISPMGYFSHKGDLPMMRWLYVKGADTRDEDVSNWFPLYAAAFNGQFEACQWLYEHGAAKDIKRRCDGLGLGPLGVAFCSSATRDVSRWLILKGALCKDDGSGDLDLGRVERDLDVNEECIEERRVLLEWAKEEHRSREAFLAFLMGTLSPPDFSPAALRDLLIRRLRSERGAQRLLNSLPSDQCRELWDEILADEQRMCPVSSLSGSSGALEIVCDFVGIVRFREARIVRQLTKILPKLNAELDERWNRDSSSGEEDSDVDESSSVSEEEEVED